MLLAARPAVIFAIGLLIGGGVYYYQLASSNLNAASSGISKDQVPGTTSPPEGSSPQSGTGSVPSIIPLSKIVYVLPRDAIPSIDDPKFVEASKADFLFNHDLVIGLDYKGVQRAYPFKILVWHEIANDVVRDTPLAVTYCPLCQSVLAFVRVLEGRTVEFGTSGSLFNSDLVMYDRWSNTFWSQIWGKGLVGRFAGHELERIPVDLMRWEEWKKLYPNTQVLSTDTGFSRAYGSDPYRGYYTSPDIWFPIANEDNRLLPKEPVWGIVVGSLTKAYQEELLRQKVVVNDDVGGLKVVGYQTFLRGPRFFERVVEGKELTFRENQGVMVDFETGSEWNLEGSAVGGPLKGAQLKRIPAVPAFWFAWATFYPGTELAALATAQSAGNQVPPQTTLSPIKPEE